MKIEFSSQRREMHLFLTIYMAAVASRANQQYRPLKKRPLSPGAYFRNPFYEFALGESVADVHYKNINRFYCRKMPFVNTGRKCNGDEFQI